MNRAKPIHNSELWLVLKSQLAEYRQNPLLNLGFILSLAIATSTLLAILILNHASRQQYHEADARLESPIAYHVVAKQGRTVSKQDFADIRKQGFSEVSPAISFRKKLASGKWISFKAMDLLALSISKPQRFDSDNVLLPKAYAESLGLSEPEVMLANNQLLPVRQIAVADWGMTALLDIALAWQLFPDIKGFGYLMVTELSPARAQLLEQTLPTHLILQQSWSLQQRAGFADALHLNLTALAILGFIVSLFIAFQAANQAWQKRSELAAQLRLFGIALSTIRLALLLEAVALVVLASAIGALIAIALVTVLLPLLGLTLNQLYQLRVSGHFDWSWQYAVWSLLISASAVMLSLLKQFKLINSRHLALAAKPGTTSLPVAFIGAVASLLLLLFALWPESGWLHIMVKFGLLLMATVALLPLALKLVIQLLLLVKNVRHFRLSFMLQDAANQIGRRFLPLAAFYLALTTSIAAALMVNSFETAFIKYLDQQLNEDLYIRFNQGQKHLIEQWLQQQPEVSEYLLYRHGVVTVGQDTVEITTYQSPRQLASLVIKTSVTTGVKKENKTANEAGKDFELAEGSGCLINEQLALRHQLTVGGELIINQGARPLICQINGIYFDYGNPGFEITVPLQLAQDKLSGLSERGFGVFFTQYDPQFKQQLISELALNESQMIEPGEIKAMALDIFNQTFVLTQAIAAVLLAVACFGLFLSAKTLELARKADLNILSSLGYSRFELFNHMLGQWLLLVGGCIVLSWPVAAVLAMVLVGKVFPASFGWSMPLVLEPDSFVIGSLIGLSCLLPALIIPLYRLRGAEHR
jgi:putative ABC transport system permease protein